MLLESDSFIPKMEMDDSIHSLLQVLGNLLDNAKEAVLQKHERNGQVRIHLNYDTEAEVFIVTVCDDGVGISEEISEKIFTLGFSTKGINRGFGLNLIHSIVKRHGGFLEFSKQTNGGTIVYLELPKRKIKMMTNVLIIEDDPMVAELNRTFVESIPNMNVIESFRNVEEGKNISDKKTQICCCLMYTCLAKVVSIFYLGLDSKEMISQ